MGFIIGQTVADYTILDELSNGEAGHVYKVEHTITRRREAMKILADGRPAGVDQAQRFIREIQLQASLSHSNIAAVHNAFWADDDLVLVSELLAGESLQCRIERGRLPLEKTLDIITEILDALRYAHFHGVIHRDISPANIFLTNDGCVKLINFGLAKATADLRVTQNGVATGSFHYMSPEQVRGAEILDARTDLYSCGVVLYELATGTKPFTGTNAFDIMQAHTDQTINPPQSIDPTLPPELEAIVLWALAKNPEQRFQSADTFQGAIAKLRGRLKQPKAAGGWLPGRLRTAVTIGFAGLVLIVAGVVGSMRLISRVHPASTGKPTAPVAVPPASVRQSPAAPPAPVADAAIERLAAEQPAIDGSGKSPRRPRKTAIASPASTSSATLTTLRRKTESAAAPVAQEAPTEPLVLETPAPPFVPEMPVAPQPTVATGNKTGGKHPIVKVGGTLKRLNPFRRRNETNSFKDQEQ